MTETTALTVPADDPGIVLVDQKAYSVWYEALKARAQSVPVMLDTKKGRDALRSVAAEIRSEKAGIKKARLRLTEGWRQMTAQANSAGKTIDDQLESLAVEVRAPLTEWEAAEERRVAHNEDAINGIRAACVVSPEDTAEDVATRGKWIWAMSFEAPQWTPEEAAGAQIAKDTAIAALRAAQSRLKQEEADRAELAKLRQEAEERAAREAAAEAERQRVDAALLEAEALEQAERDRVEQIERIKREAAEGAAREADRRAREESEASAKLERDRVQAAHDAEIAEQRRIAAEAQAEAQRMEQQRQAEAAAKRQADAEAAAEAERERKRQANAAHRTRVKTGIKTALMTCGADEETARKIVLALIAGEIPNVEVKW